jgi:hypothetical protein
MKKPAAKPPSPSRPPEPVVPSIPAKDLPRAIANAKAILDSHKAARPSNQDIPAITTWAQDKCVLETNLQLLESQARAAWRDIPPPAAPPRQPQPEVVAVAPARTPPPIPLPSPSPEVPMSPVAKPAPEQLAHLLQSLEEQLEKTKSALNRPAFIRARQAAYWKRSEVVKFAKAHRLKVPALPEFPKDPFGVASQGASALKSAKASEVLAEETAQPEAAAVPTPAKKARMQDLLEGKQVTLPPGMDIQDFNGMMLFLDHAPPRTPQERLASLGLALRCLQSLKPLTPLGLPELMGILADYANQGGSAA